MAVIVDLRPNTNHVPNLVRILLSLIVLSIGVVGCNTERVKDCATSKSVWTTVVDKFSEVRKYTDGNGGSETVYVLRLRADGFTNEFNLDVTKDTYDRAMLNGKPNRFRFDLSRMTYGTFMDGLSCVFCVICYLAGVILVLVSSLSYLIDYRRHIKG